MPGVPVDLRQVHQEEQNRKGGTARRSIDPRPTAWGLQQHHSSGHRASKRNQASWRSVGAGDSRHNQMDSVQLGTVLHTISIQRPVCQQPA